MVQRLTLQSYSRGVRIDMVEHVKCRILCIDHSYILKWITTWIVKRKNSNFAPKRRLQRQRQLARNRPCNFFALLLEYGWNVKVGSSIVLTVKGTTVSVICVYTVGPSAVGIMILQQELAHPHTRTKRRRRTWRRDFASSVLRSLENVFILRKSNLYIAQVKVDIQFSVWVSKTILFQCKVFFNETESLPNYTI